MEHTLKEGYKLAEFFTNQIFYFAGTNRLTYSTMHEVPNEAKNIIQKEKIKIPNFKLTKIRNRDHRCQKPMKR